MQYVWFYFISVFYLLRMKFPEFNSLQLLGRTDRMVWHLISLNLLFLIQFDETGQKILTCSFLNLCY